MGEIRSALEIALEKAEKLGKASKEELKKEEAISKGRRIAASFLDDPDKKSLKELMTDVDPSMLNSVIEGAMDTLLRNIVLPKEESQMERAQKALSGVMDLKGSVAAQVVNAISQLLGQFKTTYSQYREQLKAQMQAQLGNFKQAVAEQYGMAAAQALDVEALPEFQQEWSKLSGQILDQFNKELERLKTYIQNL